MRFFLFASLILLLTCISCAPTDAPAGAPEGVADPPVVEAVAGGEHEHGGHEAPIDCPLRKAGVNPDHLRPFEEVAEYIAFLDREDRASWQKPDEVVEALQLRGDETVADLGAGSGYFSFRIASKLPAGQVHAVDIEPEMVRHVHHRATSEGVKNLHADLTKPDDPGVPEGADLVFICDVLHHVPGQKAWLERIAEKMAPDGRLVIVEFKEGDLPLGPPKEMKIPRQKLVELVTSAGFELVREEPELLPYQVFLEFKLR